MSESLGFVVLARRPGQPPEPVSAVFPVYPNGLEQAQNVLESCQQRCACNHRHDDHGQWGCRQDWCLCTDFEQGTYCIGEISERTP